MNPMQMKWLISIVSRGKGEELAKLYAKSQIGAHLIVQGRGTASSDILHYLGLGSPEKDILLSLSPADLLAHKLPRLRELPIFSRAGHGIAFTIPLSGISLAAVRSIQADILLPDYSKEEPVMSQEITHDLIIAVVDDDNTDIVFDAAKAAGCRGGTIARAREVFPQEARKIFGITIQPEKDLVMILVPRADKQAILKAICNKILAETGEHGLVFSLPVSDVVGLKKPAPTEI